MTIRVRVDENFATGGLDVWVVEKGDRTRDLLRPDGQWERLTDPPGAVMSVTEPSIRLPEQAGRALLDALVRFYDGGEDTRNLRRDYDSERARVDKLIASLAGIAERATHPAIQGTP